MTRHDDPGRDRRPASELDRVLGDWLADGPRRAPAAPVTVAIEFARAHPRRARFLAGVPARPHGRSRIGPVHPCSRRSRCSWSGCC